MAIVDADLTAWFAEFRGSRALLSQLCLELTETRGSRMLSGCKVPGTFLVRRAYGIVQ